MSDYVHNKQVIYQIDTPEVERFIKDKYKVEDIFDISWRVEELESYFHDNGGKFDTECTDEHIYLSYSLYSDYGEESGEWSRIRPLTSREQEKYKPLFDQILGDIDPSKLYYVDYCWYNCCEPTDFFSVEDDFNKEI